MRTYRLWFGSNKKVYDIPPPPRMRKSAVWSVNDCWVGSQASLTRCQFIGACLSFDLTKRLLWSNWIFGFTDKMRLFDKQALILGWIDYQSLTKAAHFLQSTPCLVGVLTYVHVHVKGYCLNVSNILVTVTPAPQNLTSNSPKFYVAQKVLIRHHQ